MAADFIVNIPVPRAASQGVWSAARRLITQRMVVGIATAIANMAVRAVEFVLLCWVAIVLAFCVLIMATFIL